MKKKILITGGAGFIGSHLVERLFDTSAYEIIVLDNLNPQIHGDGNSYTFKKIKNKSTFVKGDVQDEELLVSLLKEANILVHLAAETGTGQSMYENARYVRANCLSTSYIVDFISKENNNIEKIIVASSRSIYGEGKYECLEKGCEKHGIQYPDSREVEDMENGLFECLCPTCKKNLSILPTSEDSRIHPISTYGLTKFFQENLLESACVAAGISFVGLRFQNVYGVGQSLSNPYTGIISIFSNRFRQGKGINIFEDGKESRDFVYIDDVIDSVVGSLLLEDKKPIILNVGSGEMTSVIKIAEILRSNINPNVSIEISGEFRKGDIRHNYADLTLIRNKLNFSPKFNIKEGLTLFTDWMLSQDEEDDKYEESLNELKDKGLLNS